MKLNSNRIIAILLASSLWIFIEILIVIIGCIILLAGCEKVDQDPFHVEPGLQSQILPKNACFNDIVYPADLWKAWPDTTPVFDKLNYTAIDWLTDKWQGPTTVPGYEWLLDLFIIRSVAITGDLTNWIYCTDSTNSYYLKFWQEDQELLFETNAPSVYGEWKFEDAQHPGGYNVLYYKVAGQVQYTRMGELRQVPGEENKFFLHTADSVLFMQYQRGNTL